MNEYKKFYYTYQDIAELLGISISRVRHLVSDKTLNPSLTGLFKYIQHKKELTSSKTISLNDKVWKGIKPW